METYKARPAPNRSLAPPRSGEIPEVGFRQLSVDEQEAVRNWINLAEDLLAIQVVRWLAPSLSQLWILMQFLVLGSVSLLFAINSYPFPQRGHVLGGLGVLIGLVALTIVGVLIGVNREEFMSRVSKTSPNRLSLNNTMMGPLFAYVLPLIGVLALVSLDAGDVVRSWLGPMARLLG
jgi:hypothetical protein